MCLALLADWLGPGKERETVQMMFESCPEAAPNPQIVAETDEFLCRDGRLMEALEASIEKRRWALPDGEDDESDDGSWSL